MASIFFYLTIELVLALPFLQELMGSLSFGLSVIFLHDAQYIVWLLLCFEQKG
jgi:hypothetical protein